MEFFVFILVIQIPLVKRKKIIIRQSQAKICFFSFYSLMYLFDVNLSRYISFLVDAYSLSLLQNSTQLGVLFSSYIMDEIILQQQQQQNTRFN